MYTYPYVGAGQERHLNECVGREGHLNVCIGWQGHLHVGAGRQGHLYVGAGGEGHLHACACLSEVTCPCHVPIREVVGT